MKDSCEDFISLAAVTQSCAPEDVLRGGLEKDVRFHIAVRDDRMLTSGPKFCHIETRQLGVSFPRPQDTAFSIYRVQTKTDQKSMSNLGMRNPFQTGVKSRMHATQPV